MASFVGAITEFNPYIQQIPDAYTKVGMQRELEYGAGVAKVQDSIDKIAGLDIANEGGRQYLRNRVDELTKSLNKYSTVDFSNPNNITQLTSLSKPLYQDENIVNDVINTGIYRKWSKEATDAYKTGKMELGQYMRETTDANVWLGSQSAGAQYTGRSTPNTATKKDLVDRIIKAKKDGLEKNEYVYDKNYSIDTPYYIKSTNKYYSEADFNNFIADNIISTRDREMLMNENWYENQGKPTQVLQQEDLFMYQSKVDANNKRISEIINNPLIYAGDKKAESQKVIDDLRNYNATLEKGKIKYLQSLNLNDPNTRDVFHRDLSESRFVSSLDILRDEVKKEEMQKNEQWFKDKELANEAAKAALKAATIKGKTPEELIDEVAVFTPVDPSAPRTELSLNTIRSGYQKKNDEIVGSMNSLIGKLQENGVDMTQFIAGWDQVQVGGKGGAAMNVPRFKTNADKDRFYNMVAGLNFAYTKEAEDGKMDNHSFDNWIKTNFTDYQDQDANSKFTFADKMVSDAMNTLKGTSALIPRLESLFSDKGVVRTLAQMDGAIKDKKDMANAYREAFYKSGALTTEEVRNLRNLNDDQLLGGTAHFNGEMEQRRLESQGLKPVYRVTKDADGTFSLMQTVVGSDPQGYVKDAFTGALITDNIFNKIKDNATITQDNKLSGGYPTFEAAREAYISGELQPAVGISSESIKKANEFVRKTYSYVQENVNSTVQNLKNDKPAYAAVQDGIKLFLSRSRGQATPEDLQIDGVSDLSSITGISKVEILGATVSNTQDIFNPNPMYELEIEQSVIGDDGKEKKVTRNGRISLRSFLATNPNYKTSEYAKYFAPALYAEKDAYARIKATINPLEGSQGSYSSREDTNPVFNRVNQQGQSQFVQDDPMGNTSSGKPLYGNQIQWETLPIERDGRQTMISYQVVSLGQNTVLGNVKNKDKNNYAPGAFYVKLKVPTSTGEPKVMFLKKPNGDSYSFGNASNAHYTVRDLIFNNSEIKFDELDPKTGEVNYFSTDPTTIRGIFNAQLSYNGYSKLETTKIKDALGKEIQKQSARELQFGSR